MMMTSGGLNKSLPKQIAVKQFFGSYDVDKKIVEMNCLNFDMYQNC